jgi:flagellar biosynthesis GTPase FlhF
MTLRTLSRTVVGGALQLARLPVDGVLRVAGGIGAAGGVKLILDRAEARVRAFAGKALGDEALQEDARRREVAADERERAMQLRAEAELRSERADEQVAAKERAAERRRGQAAETAKRKRRQAEMRRESSKGQAAQATRRRRNAAERSAAQSEKVIEERTKLGRLEHLDAKADALEEKEAALRTADEARRLHAAASNAKAERKER